MNRKDKNNPINVGFPLSPENRKKYQEGVDYKIENRGGGFKEYIILSEKLKADFKRYNGGLDFGNTITEQEFKMPTENPEEWQKKMKEENEKHRQKFIAENNPPKLNYVFLTSEDELWNKQQSSLTSDEKTALNDPILEHYEHWERALWFIQKFRQAESDIFPDHDFAWGDFMFERLKHSKSSDYKAVQALKNAGISLDKLLARVEKANQIKREREQQKLQEDKAKILTNLDNWICDTNRIFNLKTHQWIGVNRRGRFHIEGIDEKEIISGDLAFDEATYQELRKAVFANQLKNILKTNSEWKIEEKVEKTNHKNITLKSKNSAEYKQTNFLPTEWDQIEREVKERSIVFKRSEQISNKSPNRNNLIIFSAISLIILVALGGLLIIKKRQKKHGPKR